MELYVYVVIGMIIFLIFIAITIYSRRKDKRILQKKIRNSWGKLPEREYSFDEFEKITRFHKNKNSDGIDDITWNDLDMDTVYMAVNTCVSSVGDEVLYSIMRTPVYDDKRLLERGRIIDFFVENPETAFEFKEKYYKIGRTIKISFFDYIFRLKDVHKGLGIFHLFFPAILIAAIVMMFIIPEYMISPLILILAINVVMYYKFRGKVSAYYSSFGYLVRMLSNAEEICKIKSPELTEYSEAIKKNCNSLSSLQKGIFLLGTNTVSGSIADVIMDYMRIVFHLDIIKFYQMLGVTINKTKEIEGLYNILGEIEACISIASYRTMIPFYCTPDFSKDYCGLEIKEGYHPLIENPVFNDFQENKGTLITGSNASGKSTFLKMIAINSIFAQTIYTCLAKEYKTPFYHLFSSMALSDDIEGKESYYIVEIKSLKRILDAAKNSNHKILCFIDEVLRGTNTVERIAASSQILKSLSRENVFCFAATHDIELTYILENHYVNYHFSEEIIENDILFSYKLQKGRATTRNAIKLLSIIGYDEEVINEAEKTAERFETDGVWSLENL